MHFIKENLFDSMIRRQNAHSAAHGVYGHIECVYTVTGNGAYKALHYVIFVMYGVEFAFYFRMSAFSDFVFNLR